jgi:hypothetical protein
MAAPQHYPWAMTAPQPCLWATTPASLTLGHDCPMTCLLHWQAQKDCTYNTHASLSLCHSWKTELACPLQSIQHINQFRTISSLSSSHCSGNCRSIIINKHLTLPLVADRARYRTRTRPSTTSLYRVVWCGKRGSVGSAWVGSGSSSVDCSHLLKSEVDVIFDVSLNKAPKHQRRA